MWPPSASRLALQTARISVARLRSSDTEARAVRTLPAGFTSAPPGSPPPNHGCSRGAFPALRRIKWTLRGCDGNIPEPWIYAALMETMSPQQGTMGENRSDSLTGELKPLPENKKVPSGRVSLREP